MKFIQVNDTNTLRFSSIKKMEIGSVKVDAGRPTMFNVVFHSDDNTQHKSTVIGSADNCRKAIKKIIESDSEYIDFSQYKTTPEN